ncbi:MAG TPA: GIY-YIG nuclease family protein [Bacteroidales bacterium]|nr:GIY-YIG nuclease family protein [Bacteroidales bacterium]
MFYYVYILQSEQNGRYYIGYCSDLSVRLARYNAGATPSTKPYRPWKLVYYEEHREKTAALKREKQIKGMKSRSYIEGLVHSSGFGSSAG